MTLKRDPLTFHNIPCVQRVHVEVVQEPDHAAILHAEHVAGEAVVDRLLALDVAQLERLRVGHQPRPLEVAQQGVLKLTEVVQSLGLAKYRLHIFRFPWNCFNYSGNRKLSTTLPELPPHHGEPPSIGRASDDIYFVCTKPLQQVMLIFMNDSMSGCLCIINIATLYIYLWILVQFSKQCSACQELWMQDPLQGSAQLVSSKAHREWWTHPQIPQHQYSWNLPSDQKTLLQPPEQQKCLWLYQHRSLPHLLLQSFSYCMVFRVYNSKERKFHCILCYYIYIAHYVYLTWASMSFCNCLYCLLTLCIGILYFIELI